jgi:predicted DNA-binding protein
MANGRIISFRDNSGLLERLRAAARRSNKSVSRYIKERLEAGLNKEERPKKWPTRAAREAFERYVGGSRHGHTTENIDETVYGKFRKR